MQVTYNFKLKLEITIPYLWWKVVSRHFVPRAKLFGADSEPANQLQLSLNTLADWDSRIEKKESHGNRSSSESQELLVFL